MDWMGWQEEVSPVTFGSLGRCSLHFYCMLER